MAKVIYRHIDFTANGTETINIGDGIAAISFTVVGVGGTPTAWDLDVDGSIGFSATDTAVELDGHNSGAEALGAVVNKTVSGVVTQIDLVMASLNLNGADSAQVQLAILTH